MYYQHLAVKVLIEDNLDRAYSLLAAAMQLSPDNIETLNTLAVSHKRNDKPAVAESIYEYLLEHTKGSVSALSNYVIFLKESNRKQDAALYEDKYLEIEDDNPFNWHYLANQAYKRENYWKALYLFKKSAYMATYLHQKFLAKQRIIFSWEIKLRLIKRCKKLLGWPIPS